MSAQTSASSPAAALRLSEVDFSYGQVPVLEGVNLEVQAGEFVAVIGPNGGGKSTLLKLILGLLRAQRGVVEVLGNDPHQARRAIGYCPQTAAFRRNFPLRVLDVVLQGRLGMPGTRWRYRESDHAAANAALQSLDIAALARRPLTALSGGQLQRVLVARALVTEPRLLLLDEPSAHLDERGGHDLYDLLAELCPRMTVVVVTHDLDVVSARVNRVVCVNREVWCHLPHEIDGSVLDAMYRRHLRGVQHDHPPRKAHVKTGAIPHSGQAPERN
jgi:zinc transport system ATP-binding protein